MVERQITDFCLTLRAYLISTEDEVAEHLILSTNIWAFDYEAKFTSKFVTGLRDDNCLCKLDKVN